MYVWCAYVWCAYAYMCVCICVYIHTHRYHIYKVLSLGQGSGCMAELMWWLYSFVIVDFVFTLAMDYICSCFIFLTYLYVVLLAVSQPES